MKQWYETLFENYAKKYDSESYTKGTKGEVDFIEQEINFDKSKRILDVGCGTGRHSIELAKRGYSVTGFDLSESQLRRAKEKAEAEGVKIEFYKKDARDFRFEEKFDLLVMMCEGAFPLMETDEMNFEILKNCADTLKNGGKLIFTTLNALFPLFHSVKEFIDENADEFFSDQHSFDLMTFRDSSKIKFTDDGGVAKEADCSERYYTPSEIMWMLKSLKFTNIHICGCDIGKFSRERVLLTTDFEMLVIAEF